MKLARLLIYAVVLLLPLYYWRFSLAGIPTNVIELLVVFGVVVTIWLKATGQLPRPGSVPLKWPILLIVVGVVIGVLVADDRQVALGILKGWFAIPILFFWGLMVLEKELNWRLMAWLVVINVNVVALYALLQYGGVIGLIAHQNIGGELGQYIDQERALAFFESPNYLAMYLVPLTVLSYSYLKSRGIRLLVLAMPVLAIALSGSRSGMVALVLGGVLVWLWSKPRSQTIVRSVAGLSALAVAALLALTQNDASSESLRLYIWQQSLGFGVDNWLTGIGPGQFQGYFIEHASQASSAYQFVLPYALHPHNLFLGYWLSAGLAGLVGFVWLIVELVKLAKQKLTDPLVLGALGALAAILIHGLFDTTYFKNDLSLIFFLMVAIIAARTKTDD